MVSNLNNNIFYFYFIFYLFFLFSKSLLLACPTHTNPPSSGLSTGGILYDKHIHESKQLYLLTMRLEATLHTESPDYLLCLLSVCIKLGGLSRWRGLAGSNTQYTQHIIFIMRLTITHSISSSH